MSEIVAKLIASYAFGEKRTRFVRPATVEPVLSAEDAFEMLAADEGDAPIVLGAAESIAQGDIDEINKLVGLRLGIVYEDAAGGSSTREVTIRSLRLLADGSSLGLQCWCHAREAPRLFRMDRVRRVFDIDTGETFESFPEYLATLTGFSERPALSAVGRVAAAISAVKTNLQVLVFLARCDGWHHSELAVACNFVLDAPTTPRHIDVSELERQVRRLDPDKWVFRRALAGLQCAGSGDLDRLHRALRRLVDADGILSVAEGDFVLELGTALENRSG